MTKRSLVIIIDSGEKTCVNEKFELCPNVRTHSLNAFYICALFGGKELRDQNGVCSGPGTLQRLSECLERETFSGG